MALHLRLDGVVVDQQALGSRYEELCAAGHPLACKWRAWDDWGRVKLDDLLRITDGACTGGNTEACEVRDLGLLARDPERAAERLRAAEVGPNLAEDCAAGRTRSCEAWLPSATGADRLRALERLCHAGLRCADLAVARAGGQRGMLQPGKAATATWADGGVLLGWDGATFADHAWVPVADLVHAELVVGGSRDEHFVLVPTSGEPLVLPDLGCDVVIAGATVLAKGDRLVRAQDATGTPASSQCIEALAPTTPYRSGRLVVDAKPGEATAAAAVRASIAAAMDGLWRCAEATAYATHLEPWTATLTHAKAGPSAKVSPTGSSGDAAFDDCALAWLRAVELGPASYKTSHAIRVDLAW